MVAEAKALGKVKYEKNGTVKKEFWIPLSRIHLSYTAQYAKSNERDIIARRRAALASGDMKSWYEIAIKTVAPPATPTPFYQTQQAIFRDTLMT